MPITVSIVEDDHETRASLAELIRNTPGLSCLGTYATAESALVGIPTERPDVVLVDIRLPGISGIQCVARLKSQMPDLQLLMVTTYEERELIFDSLRAGASGYILKKASRAELVQAVEQVHVGGAPMSMPIARKLVSYFQRSPGSEMDSLTGREQEILRLLARGDQYKQIAEKLGISLDTVRTHVRHVYEKLHVRSRTAATIKFLGASEAKAGSL
jgi:DNA-binding NarL/FixJ family response regulator